MSKINTFRPGSVVSPGMFAGRLDEIRSIERGLVQTKAANPFHFIIEGERGIGKTSLLLLLDIIATGKVNIFEKGALNFLVVNVELRSTTDYEDIVDSILLELKREIAETAWLMEMAKRTWGFLSKFEVYGVSFRERETNAHSGKRLDELTDTLVHLLADAGSKVDGVLILIDEADKPAPSANLGELCKLLTERLTKRGCEKVSIGLSGLPGVIERLKESHESSPRVFQVFALKPLEDSERKEVIDRGLKMSVEAGGDPVTITDEAKEMIANLSEGYPHFLQEFAHCAFNYDSDNQIDVGDVTGGTYSENGAFDQLGKKYFNQYYAAPGSDDYRRVLIAMADHLDAWVTRAAIIAESKLKASTVDNALRALKAKQVILQNDNLPGQYRLPTKSFAVWLKIRQGAEFVGPEPQKPQK